MKSKFSGWQSVFHFTFKQATKGISFKLVTVLIAIIMIVGFVILNLVIARPEKDSASKLIESPIEAVYVLDQSGLETTDFKELLPLTVIEQYPKLAFITSTSKTREEIIEAADQNSNASIAVIITKNEAGYLLEAVVPAGSIISSNEAGALLGHLHTGFTNSKLMQAGLSIEQLTTILKPVISTFAKIGENTNVIVMVIKMIAPMLFGLMLYLMLLLHGQTISKSVSTEKTSRLMETLLTSVHPYALITGKVLAITSMALMQFSLWIIAAIAGLFGGNTIAGIVFPGYESPANTIIHFLRDNIGETAFSIPAIILAIIIFCIGFLYYSVIAGLAGSMASKPEDVATTQGLFVLPVLISWLVCYLAPISGNETVLNVARYIPFTAPFCVPVDLITGTIGLMEGMISLIILLAFSAFIIMLSARIYKGLVLYTGQKLSLKLIGSVLKAKN